MRIIVIVKRSFENNMVESWPNKTVGQLCDIGL